MVKDVVALVINISYQVSQSVGSFGRSSGSGGCCAVASFYAVVEL